MSAMSTSALIELTQFIDDFLQCFVQGDLRSREVWRKFALLFCCGAHNLLAAYGVQSIGGSPNGFRLSGCPGLAGIAAPCGLAAGRLSGAT